MIFSSRHARAIEEKIVDLNIDIDLTKRIWPILEVFNESYQFQANRYDSFTKTCTARNAVRDKLVEFYETNDDDFSDLDVEFYWKRDDAEKLDIIEYWHQQLSVREKVDFRYLSS